MEEQEKLEAEIGTIEEEKISLKPAKVKIVDVKIETIEKAKSDKAAFEVKHPDRDETIKISSVAYLSGREVVVSGTWYNLDKENKIKKGSALAVLMNKLQVKKLTEAKDKEIETELDGKYLVFKAY